MIQRAIAPLLRISDSLSLGWGLRIGISKFSGGAEAAGVETTLPTALN